MFPSRMFLTGMGKKVFTFCKERGNIRGIF